jgi:hypothetical protein
MECAERDITVSSAEQRASAILETYGQAQSELLGKAVVLTDGEVGTVEKIWLDELHGLRISIRPGRVQRALRLPIPRSGADDQNTRLE